MIDERHHRVKPESPLKVRGRPFFFRVRPDQRGIQIDDYLLIGSDRAAMSPHHLPRTSPRTPDRRDGRASIITKSIDEPTDRGIRSHRAEQLGLSPQQRDISQAIPAQRNRYRQIQHRLTRVVNRTRRPPRLQLSQQPLRQPADLRGLRQQLRTRRGNQRLTARLDPKPTTTATLHLRSAFLLAENRP